MGHYVDTHKLLAAEMQYFEFSPVMFKTVLMPLVMALLLAKKLGVFANLSKAKIANASKAAVARAAGKHESFSGSDIRSLESALGVWMNRENAELKRAESEDHPLALAKAATVTVPAASIASQQSTRLSVDASTPK